MKLIVGLGNPEEKYSKTRHNVGFMIIDELAKRKSYNEWEYNQKFQSLILKVRNTILLAKPQTSMNDSGKAVSSLATYYKLPTTNIYIIHDDLDIRIGEYKIQEAKGPKQHKGLTSIYTHLGKSNFWHVRVGIENRKPSASTNDHLLATPHTSGEDYVLQDFTEQENKILGNVFNKVIKDLISRLTKH